MTAQHQDPDVDLSWRWALAVVVGCVLGVWTIIVVYSEAP